LCGAPVDITSVVSESGWVEQPPIRDMARIQFGQSHVQITGTRVPTAEFTLSPREWIYFSHHVLLWTEPRTGLANMRLKGTWNRMMAGMPLIMMQAQGPGNLALSDNHAGEVVALPLHQGQSMWVREHRFLCATGNVGYDWDYTGVWYETRNGDDKETHYPMGMYGDTFTARDQHGLLLLHSPGNTFIRDLRPGETLLTQPSSLLYRDMSVRVNLHFEYPRNLGFAFWSNRWSYRNIWIRLTGPGRVAIQSVYTPPEECEMISNHSYATRRNW